MTYLDRDLRFPSELLQLVGLKVALGLGFCGGGRKIERVKIPFHIINLD